MEGLARDHNFTQYTDLQGDIVIYRRQAGTNAVDPSDICDYDIYPYCKRLKQQMLQNGSNVNCACEFPRRLTEAHRSHNEIKREPP